MENTELLQSKMANIDRGAYWCRVLGIVFLVIGIVVLVLAGVSLLQLQRAPGGQLTDALVTAGKIAWGSVTYFILAWLAHRASDAFESIAALIRELGEIV